MIELKELTKRFDKHLAVDSLSFSAKPGEVIGLLGPNGAGKSTTMKMISGFMPATSGMAKIAGFDIHTQTLKAQQQIGYLPEGPSSYPNMTVRSFLGFIADIRGYRGKEKQARVEDVVQCLELSNTLKTPINLLSKGLTRRVGLAQAIIHSPKILILDEPTDGLDPNQKENVRNLIKTLGKDKTILISTHILEEVSSLCSRALVISNGQLLADTSPSELEGRSRYNQAVTLVSDQPLDLLALAVLPGVSGIEEDVRTPGAITILAKPGMIILPHISTLITVKKWNVKTLTVDRGRLDEVFQNLTREHVN